MQTLFDWYIIFEWIVMGMTMAFIAMALVSIVLLLCKQWKSSIMLLCGCALMAFLAWWTYDTFGILLIDLWIFTQL